MRRVIVSGSGVAVAQVPAPRPGPGEVLVRAVVAGVCGSDLHAAHGRHPNIVLPFAPGHEVVGVVAEAGPGVTGLAPGLRVTVEPPLPCLRCKQCLADRANLCENLAFFGCGHPQGGMADYFTVPAHRLHPVPDDLDYRTAALIEPLASPVHAVRLAGDVAGRTVVILGAGTIGLLTLAVVRAHGARRVVVTNRSAAKRPRILALGADAAVDAAAPDALAQVRAALGESADVVFDCVAVQSTMDQAIGLAGKGGTVVVLGVPVADVTVPLAVVQDQQIRIQGSATYLPADIDESIRLLRDGTVRATDIVTATHPLSDVAAAFADAEHADHIKVLVVVDPPEFGPPPAHDHPPTTG
jgi:2-desacetyl-2-hydroxyethyl bacteriochlorophyllide A dehydrogenase